MRGFLPIIIPTVALFLLALLFGRLRLLVAPLVGWPIFFLGLTMGWWGYGVGESWQFILVLSTLIGAIAVALGWALHRLAFPDRRSRFHRA
jgi:hypothetical protein